MSNDCNDVDPKTWSIPLHVFFETINENEMSASKYEESKCEGIAMFSIGITQTLIYIVLSVAGLFCLSHTHTRMVYDPKSEPRWKKTWNQKCLQLTGHFVFFSSYNNVGHTTHTNVATCSFTVWATYTYWTHHNVFADEHRHILPTSPIRAYFAMLCQICSLLVILWKQQVIVLSVAYTICSEHTLKLHLNSQFSFL